MTGSVRLILNSGLLSTTVCCARVQLDVERRRPLVDAVDLHVAPRARRQQQRAFALELDRRRRLLLRVGRLNRRQRSRLRPGRCLRRRCRRALARRCRRRMLRLVHDVPRRLRRRDGRLRLVGLGLVRFRRLRLRRFERRRDRRRRCSRHGRRIHRRWRRLRRLARMQHHGDADDRHDRRRPDHQPRRLALELGQPPPPPSAPARRARASPRRGSPAPRRARPR